MHLTQNICSYFIFLLQVAEKKLALKKLMEGQYKINIKDSIANIQELGVRHHKHSADAGILLLPSDEKVDVSRRSELYLYIQ